MSCYATAYGLARSYGVTALVPRYILEKLGQVFQVGCDNTALVLIGNCRGLVRGWRQRRGRAALYLKMVEALESV